ncbi:hypothetical protein V6N11_009907 [Hibiscus sabdariffa]|uniref:Uncharacterized protein n=1 Tax=Hibiscus sabdariffa TaxID=183260 RepID=A0ABR2PD28_9ROSI
MKKRNCESYKLALLYEAANACRLWAWQSNGMDSDYVSKRVNGGEVGRKKKGMLILTFAAKEILYYIDKYFSGTGLGAVLSHDPCPRLRQNTSATIHDISSPVTVTCFPVVLRK